MLLIGSRAIRWHFPDFRPPQDWDLIGSADEIAWLEQRLPSVPTTHPEFKRAFQYDEVVVEVTNASKSAYWAEVLEEFSAAPTIDEDVLGRLHVAPAAFLLLTKQCGLVYGIYHWHKNLEDLYFLRDRIPTIPESVARFQPLALEDSRRMFEDRHTDHPLRTCHPSTGGPIDAAHRLLHDELSLVDEAPAVALPSAWAGFPDYPSAERSPLMERLLAEEAMVLAVEDFRARSSGLGVNRTGEFLNRALRELCTGCLPVGWRYFCVNHFREILALVPQGFLSELGDLADGRKVFPRGTGEALSCAPAPVAALHPPATGALRLPRVVGGETCSERRAASAQSCSPLPE
ncbi:MAG: hypothetical protein AB7S68_17135 [Polyangiaceae bacterium]